MKKITNILIWSLLLFLITPSTMALASWNAVPGDKTYSWKLSLEKTLLLFMSPSSKLQSATQVKIAERRFSELEQTLSGEYAFESLDNLEKQLKTTTSNIQKINKQENKDQVKKQYVDSLKKMSSSLNEQKSRIAAGEVPAVVQKSTNNTNISNPTAVPTSSITPTPVTVPSNDELIDEIEDIEDEIDQAIIEAQALTVNDEEGEEKKEDVGGFSAPSAGENNDKSVPTNGDRDDKDGRDNRNDSANNDKKENNRLFDWQNKR